MNKVMRVIKEKTGNISGMEMVKTGLPMVK
jgi:hypothetical protein